MRVVWASDEESTPREVNIGKKNDDIFYFLFFSFLFFSFLIEDLVLFEILIFLCMTSMHLKNIQWIERKVA
jgi:hypothetical protein